MKHRPRTGSNSETDWITYPIEIRSKVTVDLNYNKASPQQSTILKRNMGSQSVPFRFCQITPTQTTYLLLASLVNFNEGGFRET